MRKLPLVAALLATYATTGAASVDAAVRDRFTAANGASSWIVALDEAPLAAAGTVTKVRRADGTLRERLDVETKANRAYLARLQRSHADFLALAEKTLGRRLEPEHRFTITANGMALALTADEAARLRTLPGVAGVGPNASFEPATDVSVNTVGAPSVWDAVLAGNLATRGEGIVVGVIDLGINWAHPSFADVGGDGYNHTNPRGRVFGTCRSVAGRCNDKLIGVYDFLPNSDGTGSDATGHGSHVASTVAGNRITVTAQAPTLTRTRNVSGVAPHASLISYKACGPGPTGCPFSALIESLDQAVEDQVDIVNMSITQRAPDPWASARVEPNFPTDYHVPILNARSAGVLVVAIAGNDGPAQGTMHHIAPWTLTVAASTHGRVTETALTGVSGTGVAVPLTFTGVGVTSGLAEARVVHAKDFGNAICGTGPTESPPTGGSNPFPPGTFNGEIVICDRGTYGRVEKGFNLRIAGAGGMVLANREIEGETTVSDPHHLPAVHLGFAAGRQLSQIVENARTSGGAIRAGISGIVTRVDADQRDRLAAFSGRGPLPGGGDWLKPDLAAPGVSIDAAAQTGNGIATFFGTSMAAPHVAGAAALVAAAHPSWTPSQLESALLTTTADVVRDVDGSVATPMEAGSGRLQVDAAVRAGLAFNVTRAQYLAADPRAGGNPATLNRPSLVDDGCFERCSFQRTVTDMAGGGTWRVELIGDAARIATVTPSEFTLASGAAQALSIAIDVTAADVVGRWARGSIVLRPVSRTDLAATRVPLYVYAVPGSLPAEARIVTPKNTGSGTVSVPGLLAMADLAYRTSSLERSVGGALNIAQDTTPDDAFDDLAQVTTRFLLVPPGENASVLFARTSSATARDVDLFVGLDDGDGQPELAEAVCRSVSSDASEQCEVAIAAAIDPRTYWVVVQNAEASTGSDRVDVIAAAPTLAQGGTQLVATGPSRTGRLTPFDVRLAIDEQRLQAGDTWVGYTELGSNGRADNIGRFPVLVTTSNAGGPGASVLGAVPGDALVLDLLPNAAHERIVVDVPPNATSLSVSIGGAAGDSTGEVDLYVAKATSTAASSSTIPVAPPRAQAQRTSTRPGLDESVLLTAPELTPGRWYVTPVNTGATRASVIVSTAVQTSGAAPAVRANGYFNPSRSGHGVLLSEGGDQRVLIWYTYLPDGTPTWYLAQGPRPAATAGAWQAPLYRFTWDGAASHGTIVGEATMTPSATNAFTFSWLVDGQYGSEPMIELSPRACPSVAGTPTEYSGTWFAPQTPGYGFSVLTYASTEVQVAYLYDNQGVPRWLYGQNAPFGSGNFALSQFTGFCPSCVATAVNSRNAGTLVRTLADQGNGTTNVAGTFQAPVAGTWNTNQTTTKLTDNLGCN